MATRKKLVKKVGRPKGSPKTGGRKKGTPNKVTTAAREAAALIVDDPTYREKLLAAAQARELPPAVETMLWHYAKGKPKETFDHSGEFRLRWGTPPGEVTE